MRENVRAFVTCATEAFVLRGPVFAFGARRGDEDETTDLRPLFNGRPFTGGDLRIGGTLGRGEKLAIAKLADESAGTIVCFDALEHVFDIRHALDELYRVLMPGGVLIVSTTVDAPLDQHPGDYWRITPSCLAQLLTPFDATVVGSQGAASGPHTLLAVGCKGPVPPSFAAGVGQLIEDYQQWLEQRSNAASWPQRALNTLAGCFCSSHERRRRRDLHRVQFAVHVPLVENWKQHALANPFASKATGTRLDLS